MAVVSVVSEYLEGDRGMAAGSRVGALLVVLVLLVGGLAVACGGGDDDDDGGGDEDPAAVEAQALFVETGCAECHGENGEGDGENARTVVMGTRMIIQQFEARVRNGRGSAMPGYGEDQLTEEQIDMLWEWLRE
jgi:mono/diheme cytochrome c family protein